MSIQTDLALKLNGIEYPINISDDLVKSAKDNGLLIVHPQSDDLCMMLGALADELQAWEGGKFYYSNVNRVFSDEVDKYGFWIEQVWCDHSFDMAWTYQTNIPACAKFLIREDDDIYGEGLVIDTEHLKIKNSIIGEVNEYK